ncbi:hypothetical protein OCU04_005636 [Sclerotinia nivalis]|uniref:Uncharacterized protein n=1 Tax=Sclerotinia nivalis TaxID=352851 RepID=A0A9X0DN13_9HELO|nr:hypothetical protein OCU04_005636 [Sclerotinia nivalis]
MASNQTNHITGVSMKELFGDHCSASVFRHDNEMRQMTAIIVAEMNMSSQQTQTTVESKSSPMPSGHFEELTLTAARWENKSHPSTPTPSQKGLTGTSGEPWSEEIVTSSPAPPSHLGVASISQTPGSIATKSGSSSSSQISRRRTATEIISPPPLKRVRLSQDSQVDGPTSSKSPTPSTSAAVSKQRILKPIDEPSKGSVDLELPLTTLMEKLDTVPTLCENTMKALMNLQNGDLEVETYIAQELPNLKSINTQIDQLVPPSVLSALHMTMLSFSQETLDILSEFQSSFEGNSGVHIDVNTYFCRQFSPLQYLTQEFKQVTSYLTQPQSQHKPWDSTKSLDSMSKIFQLKANNDGDMIGHRDIFTLVDDNELATDDDIENDNDHHTQNHGSYLIAAGGNHNDSENRPFHDPIDNITRCGDCGHEIWEDQAKRFEWMPGFCTGCGNGPNPFYENIDFPGALPRIFEEEDYGSEVSSQEARVLIGNTHLDYQSSAYDTQDEDSQLVLNEEYEVNSFIDDDEPDSDSESHTSDHGSEVDYKAAFQNLQKEFTELRNDYFALVDEYSQFKYDMLGTTEEEEDDDGDDEEEEDVLINEDGAHVVDVGGGENEKSGEDEDVGAGEQEEGGEREVVYGDGDGDGDGDESAGENLDGVSTVARSHTLSNLREDSVEL